MGDTPLPVRRRAVWCRTLDEQLAARWRLAVGEWLVRTEPRRLAVRRAR